MNTTEIFTSELPVGEKLSIKRTRFEPNEKSKNKTKRIKLKSFFFFEFAFFQKKIYHKLTK